MLVPESSQSLTLLNVNEAEAILLGFQHYLVMLGTTVLIPSSLVPQMGGGNVSLRIKETRKEKVVNIVVWFINLMKNSIMVSI